MPNTKPTRAAKPTPANTVRGCTAAVRLVRAATSLARPSPTAVPMTPPNAETVEASRRNWMTMVRRRAPSARRTPISRVRSRTLTSMMFMMPMPPTMRVMTPTATATP